ncbi:helix-turn-helix transcriptional regulator [Natribacillus halophilus]|uniref:DNA-binding transcriptional regulator, XRE-family HTH domain n=1 Tax=Natribacillus halophilus TaxID=549003 RepID=A0A1G8RWH6_9BACI|nr:helix-turn-helix transcriptional regulator [Natribacillus halophilus]SDJ20865.1 DNA-binding transcriptional regulator, XRE-family HTH domain [Natribacillus halophilus]
MNNSLRAIRKSKGVTQAFISRELGYSYPSGYANIEMGRVKLSLHNAMKIAEILNVDVEDIFFDDELHTKGKKNNSA